MHLPKLPTIFVKGDEERKAFFTVQAREFLLDGWVEKEDQPAPVKASKWAKSKEEAAPEKPEETEAKPAEAKEVKQQPKAETKIRISSASKAPAEPKE